MPEMGKFKPSRLLITTSLIVLRQNLKLLLFPMLTVVSILGIVLFFALPVVLMPTGQPIWTGGHWLAVEHRIFEGSPSRPFRETVAAVNRGDPSVQVEVDYRDSRPRQWLTIYLAIGYLACMFIATFSNVAFANEIFNALNGRDVSVGSGLRFAWSRVGSILVWSLFAGVVGLLIQSLERRFGWIGKIILRLVGVVWSVASVFVIPVIVRDAGMNPVELLQKSAGTLRKTWGETLIGYAGIQFAVTMLLLASLSVAVMTALPAVAFGAWPIAVAIAVVWLVAVMSLGYVSGVADQIYRCALYVYACEGVMPEPFSAEMMDMAWKVKSQ
jgi:hypothetical protein